MHRYLFWYVPEVGPGTALCVMVEADTMGQAFAHWDDVYGKSPVHLFKVEAIG